MLPATLHDFARALQPHDRSTAAALIELFRRADDDGTLDRGEWLAAVRSVCLDDDRDHVYPGLLSEEDADEDMDAFSRYVEEHVLAQLAGAGIASGEPDGPGWERVRISPPLWEAVRDEKDVVPEAISALVRKLPPTGDVAPGGNGATAAPQALSGSTLTASGLVKAYRKRNVVNDVHIAVSQGEIVGLLGPNGAGKTTTFYMIVGLITPDEGAVVLDQKDLTDVPMYQRARRGIGYLAQEPSVFRKLTVEENIMAILQTMKLSAAERERRLETLLDDLSIKHLRHSRAYTLSGGERRRLEITRALVSQPKFMLLDEPFAGVDPIAVHDIQQIVAGLRHRGIGVIITDHNVEQTLDIVDRAYIMYEGKVRVSGTVAELVWNEEVAEIYFGPTLTARMRERYRRPEFE